MASPDSAAVSRDFDDRMTVRAWLPSTYQYQCCLIITNTILVFEDTRNWQVDQSGGRSGRRFNHDVAVSMATNSSCFQVMLVKSHCLTSTECEYQNVSKLSSNQCENLGERSLKTESADKLVNARAMPPLLFVGYQQNKSYLEKLSIHPKKFWSYASSVKTGGFKVENLHNIDLAHEKNVLTNGPISPMCNKSNLSGFTRSSLADSPSSAQSISPAAFQNVNDDNFFSQPEKTINVQAAPPQLNLKDLDVTYLKERMQSSNSSCDSGSSLHRDSLSKTSTSSTNDNLTPTVKAVSANFDFYSTEVSPTDANVSTARRVTHQPIYCPGDTNNVKFSDNERTFPGRKPSKFPKDDRCRSASRQDDPWHYGSDELRQNENITKMFVAPHVQEEENMVKFPSSGTNFTCEVCGEEANGNFFGASVCLPCKVRVKRIFIF
ncbi:hypothetical protein ElyMa_000414100 [Elysia marginata]|uniref:Nuclear receptor domain-containing protein n=1 Tax=Elysia marginata TaxID=1093978 RepID=A0AAV4FM96_9GAST|nr:hypothetical protein ElyMa_000414100 [Elysia marginata]